MFLKVSSLASQYFFSFFLSHNSSSLSAMSKCNQHCGVLLHALNVSFPLQKLNPECSVVVSYFICLYVFYVFVLLYTVWFCLSTSLLMENFHLLLGNRSGLCDLFSHMGAALVLNLTKISLACPQICSIYHCSAFCRRTNSEIHDLFIQNATKRSYLNIKLHWQRFRNVKVIVHNSPAHKCPQEN